jgi:inorganic pyrophosphatase
MANRGKSLRNPSKLKPIENEKEKLLRVVLETPKGSRNKFSFNEEDRVFELKTVLPAGMSFPYDFGFAPSTVADDGDPVDVLVLMDEPAYPGCVVHARPIGIIEGKEGKGKKWERNDRIVAVEIANHDWGEITHIDDLGKKFLEELEEFFVNYHRLSKKEYRIVGVHGPGRAMEAVRKGIKALKK